MLAVMSLFSLNEYNVKLFRKCIADRNGILERAIFKMSQLSLLFCLSYSDNKRVGKVNTDFLKTSHSGVVRKSRNEDEKEGKRAMAPIDLRLQGPCKMDM